LGVKIVLANPRGFCAGVHMAIQVVDQALDLLGEEPIYVYHEIVHNKHVVGRFRERGVTFVEDVADVPEGAIVIFSAHGVSPAVRQAAAQRGLRAIDATCPLVTKVHMEALRYARLGYQILLIGHQSHQEVVGTRGEAPAAIQVVESPADIPRLHVRDPDRLVYLTQTTLSVDDAETIISALRRAFPKIKSPPKDDICYATTNRQTAVRELAAGCDLAIVIGSKNSSNSVRLTEIAATRGVPSRLIDDAGELRREWFEGVARVLVTAGASAPEDLVAGVCRTLVGWFGAEIDLRSVVDEGTEFALPAELRRMMRERAVDPKDRTIRFAQPAVTADLYGATPLTVGVSDSGSSYSP
jgi:4-hydroxy-3-methylbut-2-enyl diphosphate reductase